MSRPLRGAKAWRRGLGALLTLALVGCASLPDYLPDYWPGTSALDFWADALEADETGRDALWRRATEGNKTWQLALLQSLPDYRRYDPKRAKRALEEIVSARPVGDVPALARVRLAEMASERTCHAQLGELQHRLDQIIAIEKKIDGNR